MLEAQATGYGCPGLGTIPWIPLILIGFQAACAQNPDTIRQLDLVFAANIADHEVHCTREESGGCGLYVARLSWNTTQHTLAVDDMATLQAEADQGYWHPDLYRIDPYDDDYQVAYVRTDPRALGLAGRNTIRVARVEAEYGWEMADCPAEMEGARFPAISDSGGYLTYAKMVDDTTNVHRRILDVDLCPASDDAPISTSADLCQDDASDPIFVSGTDHLILYHCTGEATSNVKLVEHTDQTNHDRVAHDSEQNCGHFGVTADGGHAVCSTGSHIHTYGTGTDDEANRQFNVEGEDQLLLSQNPSFYVDKYEGFEGCSDLVTAYASYGNTSDSLLYSVLCSDPGQLRSKLFLATVSPDNPLDYDDANINDVIPISHYLQEYLEDHRADFGIEAYGDGEIDGLDFCTGDLDLTGEEPS